MADVKVPLKFEIYKGDELVREEILNQDVIKVGKLASSHLRIDDETVSRMHAVIEDTGPDDVHIIDLGSTRGTLVNGERINKARLQSGDEIMFGESRVIVSFLEAQAAVAPPPQAAAPAPRGGRTNAGGFAPPMQAPCTRAMVGLGQVAIACSMPAKRPASSRLAACDASPWRFMYWTSAPALNTLPWPARTTHRTPGSFAASENACVISAAMVSSRVLNASGRAISTRSTPPSRRSILRTVIRIARTGSRTPAR